MQDCLALAEVHAPLSAIQLLLLNRGISVIKPTYNYMNGVDKTLETPIV